jgi:hypothetical protein
MDQSLLTIRRRVAAGIPRLPCLLLATVLAGGCATVSDRPAPSARGPNAEKLAVRNNAASLLYDLLGDEKDVSKVLLIKLHTRQLSELIKAISATARDNRKLLEDMAKNDPQLNLQLMDLPAGEKAARESEGKSKEHDLLFTSGKEFEFNLLLTQTEALNYGWHLAKVAAENSARPEEVQQFTSLYQTLEDLYRQVFQNMRDGNY